MSGSAAPVRRKRKVMSYDEEREILRRIRSGESVTSVAQIFNTSTMKIYSIKKQSSEMNRKKKITEGALSIWIKESNLKFIPLDRNAVKHMAYLFYRKIEEQELSIDQSQPYYHYEKNIFYNSDLWLSNFLKRNGLSNMEMIGETPKDKIAIDNFIKELTKIITQGGYTPDNVFNAAETRFFWKKLPSKTKAMTIEESDKAAAEYKTLLLCSNASGDCTLKPVFINKSLRPESMKNVDLDILQLHWKVSQNCQITYEIFKEWFHHSFVPEVREYMKNKDRKFKVLLLLDDAPWHEELIHPNIKIVYIPRNFTSWIQPLSLGIVAEFKLQYIKRTFEHILTELEKNDKLSTADVWEDFTLYNCVKFVSVALSEVKPSTLNMCWRPLWPTCVMHTVSESKNTSELYADIILLAQAIGKEGFDELTDEDITEMISEEFIGRGEHSNGSKDSNSGSKCKSIDKGKKSFTADSLAKGIQLADELESFFLRNDPIVEQAKQFQQDLRTIMTPYRQLYEELKNPQTQDMELDANEQNVDASRAVNVSPLTISSDDSDH